MSKTFTAFTVCEDVALEVALASRFLLLLLLCSGFGSGVLVFARRGKHILASQAAIGFVHTDGQSWDE